MAKHLVFVVLLVHVAGLVILVLVVTSISLVLVIHAHVVVLSVLIVIVLRLLVVEILVVLHVRKLVLLACLLPVLRSLLVSAYFVRASDLELTLVSLFFEHVSVPIHLVLLLGFLVPSKDVDVGPASWRMVHFHRRSVALTHIVFRCHFQILLPEGVIIAFLGEVTVVVLGKVLLLLKLVLLLLLRLLISIVLPSIRLRWRVPAIFLTHVLLVVLIPLVR